MSIETECCTPLVQDRLSLRSNFTWTFAGNLIYAACQWGVLIVMTKTSSAARVGDFALGLAVTAPVMILANQGLRELQATDASHQFGSADYFHYRLWCAAAAVLFIVFLTRVSHYPVVVTIVGLAKGFESISDIVYGSYQQQDRMDRTAISLIARGVLAVLFVAALMLGTHSITLGATGIISANALVLALYDGKHVMRSLQFSSVPGFRSRIRRSIMPLALLSLPLGLAQTLNSTATNIPRYFLEHYVGSAGLGVFAAIMYILIAGRTFIASLAQSCATTLSRLFIQVDPWPFRALLAKQIIIALVLGFAGFIGALRWGGLFLRIIYGPAYAARTDLLIIAMFIAMINYMAEFTGTALTAVRAIRIQPVLLAGCVAVVILLSAALIPRYGVTGAAWTVAIMSAFQLIAYTLALARACIARPRPQLLFE